VLRDGRWGIRYDGGCLPGANAREGLWRKPRVVMVLRGSTMVNSRVRRWQRRDREYRYGGGTKMSEMFLRRTTIMCYVSTLWEESFVSMGCGGSCRHLWIPSPSQIHISDHRILERTNHHHQGYGRIAVSDTSNRPELGLVRSMPPTNTS
jgi:hypothetical protein